MEYFISTEMWVAGWDGQDTSESNKCTNSNEDSNSIKMISPYLKKNKNFKIRGVINLNDGGRKNSVYC